jgi:multiple sugar transport system substrate-binding protein
MKRGEVAGLALGLAAVMTGCAGGSGNTGPVSIELWSDKNGFDAAAKSFNDSHPGVSVKVVKVPSADLVNKLSNAHKAGDASKTACLAQSDNRNGGALLSQGVIAPLNEYLDANKGSLDPAAVEAVSLAGKTYGVPNQRQPIFTVFYAPAFKKAGLAYPKSWEEMIAAGKKLKEDGVSVFNLAGEDPSTFMDMAWQGGARWYSISGDSWKVTFTDDASKKAADIMQQLIDGDLIQKISYADYPAMMQQYDEGKIAARQLSTWQLVGHQRNMKTSLGMWEPAANLGIGGKAALSAADTGALVVPSLCKNKKEAVEAAVWLATQSAPINALADPVNGVGWFPAVIDASPYLGALVPKQLFGEHATQAVPVFRGSVKFAEGWIYGPDSTAMYTELASQWGKAMNKEIKVADVLTHMQEWTVADLKKSGVNVHG